MTRMKLSECEICSRLGDSEYASSKYGSDDSTSLPAEASRLLAAQPDPGGDRRSFIKRCPVCGTFYLYETDYEYLVNGSEDSEELTRLTPNEAAGLATQETREALVESLRADLGDTQAINRRYAGMSLAAHSLDKQDMPGLESVLRHPDGEVVLGALLGLRRWTSRQVLFLDILAGVRGALEHAAATGSAQTAALARIILEDMRTRHEKNGLRTAGSADSPFEIG